MTRAMSQGAEEEDAEVEVPAEAEEAFKVPKDNAGKIWSALGEIALTDILL